jgi:penicillin-binding protein 1C
MYTRVIPNGVRDLTKTRGARLFRSVIKTSWARSLALLGMTVGVIWLALPKPPLLDGISFSQCVRDRNGKLLRVTLTADQKFRIRTPLAEISPDLVAATLQ